MKYTLFAIGLLVALVQGQEPEAVPTTPFNCVSGAADALKLVSQATGSGITPARCVATCVSADLPFAFVAGGFEGNCFCSSNASPSGASVLPLSVCDTVCADGISRGCGGLNDTAVGTFAVYATSPDLTPAIVPTPSKTPTVVGITLPPANYVYGTYAAVIFLFATINAIWAWSVRPVGKSPASKKK